MDVYLAGESIYIQVCDPENKKLGAGMHWGGGGGLMNKVKIMMYSTLGSALLHTGLISLSISGMQFDGIYTVYNI